MRYVGRSTQEERRQDAVYWGRIEDAALAGMFQLTVRADIEAVLREKQDARKGGT